MKHIGGVRWATRAIDFSLAGIDELSHEKLVHAIYYRLRTKFYLKLYFLIKLDFELFML